MERCRPLTIWRNNFSQDVYFKFSPTAGTSDGLHQYDCAAGGLLGRGRARTQVAALHEIEKKVEAIDPSALDAPVAGDREILLGNIKSELLIRWR